MPSNSSASGQARYWLITLHNPDWIPPTELPPTIAWLRGQKEIGSETERIHWQLFASFKRPARLAALKKIFGREVHADPSRSEAAEEYVWKEDTAIAGTRFELGKKPFQRNSKTDWEGAKLAAQQGRIDDCPPDVYIKYYSTLKRIAMDHMEKPVDLATCCGIWIYGPPGVGKSHYAREFYKNAYFKPQNKWWDGYQNEKNVIIDDFDSKQLGHLLKIWADKYSFVAETKGFSINIRPQNIVITSNYSIEEIFQEDWALCEAIKRRFYIIKIENKRF